MKSIQHFLVAVIFVVLPLSVHAEDAAPVADNGGKLGPKFHVTMDLVAYGKPIHVDYVEQCLKFTVSGGRDAGTVYYAPRYGGFRIDTDQAVIAIAAPNMASIDLIQQPIRGPLEIQVGCHTSWQKKDDQGNVVDSLNGYGSKPDGQGGWTKQTRWR